MPASVDLRAERAPHIIGPRKGIKASLDGGAYYQDRDYKEVTDTAVNAISYKLTKL